MEYLSAVHSSFFQVFDGDIICIEKQTHEGGLNIQSFYQVTYINQVWKFFNQFLALYFLLTVYELLKYSNLLQ